MDMSVVIPTFDRPIELEICVKSILNQNFSDKSYEIVIVDDGSSEQKKANLERIINHSSIKYFRQENKGPSAARNKGIKASSGKIITFIDDDCVAGSNWLVNICKKFGDDISAQVLQGPVGYTEPWNILKKTHMELSGFIDETRIIDSEDFGGRYALYFGSGNVAIRRSFIFG